MYFIIIIVVFYYYHHCHHQYQPTTRGFFLFLVFVFLKSKISDVIYLTERKKYEMKTHIFMELLIDVFAAAFVIFICFFLPDRSIECFYMLIY